MFSDDLFCCMPITEHVVVWIKPNIWREIGGHPGCVTSPSSVYSQNQKYNFQIMHAPRHEGSTGQLDCLPSEIVVECSH